MKDQIANELVKLLQSANSATEGAGNFLQQKIPELCQQIVNWELAFHLFFFLFFLSMIGFGVYVMKMRWKEQKKCDRYSTFDPTWIGGLLTTAISVILFVVNGVSIIYTLVFPDLVVLNYFRNIH